MSLSSPFIQRPVATTLLTAAVAFAGALAYLLLPVSPLPQVEFPTIQVSASLPGASPETMASSVATVLERHLGWKKSLLGYTIASYVAASRLHDNRHYLSDVLFGAAVGTIAGRTVTEHGAEMWTFTPARVPGGIALLATRRY